MNWWQNLSKYESKGWAQAGEDGILRRIFEGIGDGGRYCVEFGAGDGVTFSNTKQFRNEGWDALLLDGNPRSADVLKAWITRENINKLFDNHGVPSCIDLLSIDIDGNDLWVWEAISRPSRVTIIECNPRWGPSESKTIVYNPKHRWAKDAYYGASVLAMRKLAHKKHMKLVYFNGLNAIFVKSSLLPKQHNYQLVYKARPGHPMDKPPKPWVDYP